MYIVYEQYIFHWISFYEVKLLRKLHWKEIMSMKKNFLKKYKERSLVRLRDNLDIIFPKFLVV
jgi:hypothetical protein